MANVKKPTVARISEAQAFARDIVDSPEYRTALKARALSGALDPSMERELWHYAHGKPPEVLEVRGQRLADLVELSDVELNVRAKAILERIERRLNGTSEGVSGTLADLQTSPTVQ